MWKFKYRNNIRSLKHGKCLISVLKKGYSWPILWDFQKVESESEPRLWEQPLKIGSGSATLAVSVAVTEPGHLGRSQSWSRSKSDRLRNTAGSAVRWSRERKAGSALNEYDVTITSLLFIRINCCVTGWWPGGEWRGQVRDDGGVRPHHGQVHHHCQLRGQPGSLLLRRQASASHTGKIGWGETCLLLKVCRGGHIK